jgi:predicted dehydrogenase
VIRFGIIGAGNNAAGHARYFHANPRTEVVAVADPDAGRATALAGEVEARPVADYTEFLDAVDAVVISSPNHLHREHAVGSARAGKHVYCEKPMGIHLDEARAIAAAINDAGVQSGVGFSVQFGGVVQTMKRLMAEGRIGKLISVWSRRLVQSKQPRTGWRADHAKSGGLLFEINIHELDWMMSVGGDVERVYAQTRTTVASGPRSNDHLWVMMNFAGGAVGSHEGSWHSAAPNHFKGIHGTVGAAYTDEWGQQLYVGTMGEQEREEIATDEPYDKRANFLDCIEHGAEPAADVNWGLKVMTVAEAVFRSAETGQPIDLREGASL